MNLNKGHNVFSDIPGFDASKGERIVKALQKLWKKIEYLEQIRISERKSKSKEVLSSSRDEDLTVTDVQYKLLVLQLQYVRSILRQKLDKDFAVSHPKDIQGDKNDPTNIIDCKVISQETQTGGSLIEGWNPYSNVPQNSNRMDNEVTTDNQQLKSGVLPDRSPSFTARIPQSTSKPHYHLKLDDVPFILGASSTASHSVVANVQNIIAMMKSHNKALCGSKQHVSQLPSSSHFTSADSQDTTKMLNELSRDLCELALKQEKIVKRFDFEHKKNLGPNLKSFEANKSVTLKNTTTHSTKRCRSNSESSIKLQAGVRNSSTTKEKDIDSVQQKQTMNIRSQSSNNPIMARRKLLRTLQNFKSHLSEEDISWD